MGQANCIFNLLHKFLLSVITLLVLCGSNPQVLLNCCEPMTDNNVSGKEVETGRKVGLGFTEIESTGFEGIAFFLITPFPVSGSFCFHLLKCLWNNDRKMCTNGRQPRPPKQSKI